MIAISPVWRAFSKSYVFVTDCSRRKRPNLRNPLVYCGRSLIPVEVCTAAMCHGKNKRFFLLWKKEFLQNAKCFHCSYHATWLLCETSVWRYLLNRSQIVTFESFNPGDNDCFGAIFLLVWKTLSLAGSVHVWFIKLHVRAVMPVTSAKRSGIFPRVLMNI